MVEFFSAALAFPTVIFSLLLIPVLLYWLTVLVGAMDLEILDGAGSAEGVEVDAPDADGGDDGDDGEGHGHGLLASLGLSGVPLTLSLSLLIVLSWFVSFAGTVFWRTRGISVSGWLLGLGVGLGILLVALVSSFGITRMVVARLRPLLATRHAQGREEFVGKVCTVTTGRVDANFGQAEVKDPQGAVLLIQVRCLKENPLQRGHQALIYDYQNEQEVFLVAPLKAGMNVRAEAGQGVEPCKKSQVLLK